MKIKIIICLLILSFAGGIYTYYKYNANKLIKLENNNQELTKKLEEIAKEANAAKIKIAEIEVDSLNIKNDIADNRLATDRIRAKGFEVNRKYAEKIATISTDNTDILTRCNRMCADAEALGKEFQCPRNYCEQFPSNGSTITRE